MSEVFIAQIKMFAGNFAPRGFALCDGQLLAISGNDALFSLLGTTYGGDGRTTFALPDLRGRIPIHAGTGPGLSQRRLGQKSGQEKVTVTPQQLPTHTHTFQASTTSGTLSNPQNSALASSPNIRLYRDLTPTVPMAATAVTSVGGSQSHTNIAPFQCINYIIALTGTFPSRN